MRVLLDECLPRGLKKHLAAHNVATVPEAGWAGTKNGALLSLATGNFEAFITVDQNVVYQQTLSGLPFVVIILMAPTNRLPDLLPLIPAILAALSASAAGQVVRVGG